ncbi:MAG TPA: AMIN domain-containing protein, partial [Polyangiaceae bacterium]
MRSGLWLGAILVMALPSVARADAAALNHVKDVRVHAGAFGAATDVEVTATDAPQFQARLEAGGKRLVVDLTNTDVTGAPDAITGTNGLSAGVLTRAFSTDGHTMTRIVVNLANNATYRLKPDGNTLHILLYGALGSSAASTLASAEKSSAKNEATTELAEVRFERKPESPGSVGKDRIVIGLSTMPAYSLDTSSSGRVRLTLRGTKVPDGLLRTLDVAPYRGTLRTVTTSKDEKSGDCVIEIDRFGADQGEVAVEGDKLVWSFDVPKSRVQSPLASARSVRTVAREEEPTDVPKVLTSFHEGESTDGTKEATAGGGEAGFAQSNSAQAVGRYNGRRIDLDL